MLLLAGLAIPPITFAVNADQTSGYVHIQNGRFYESDGSPIRFFGVNYAEALDYWGTVEEADFDRMVTYGFNLIRLNINWDLLEPREGTYSEEYLHQLDQVIGFAGKYHIYVLLDLHTGDSVLPTWVASDVEIWNPNVLGEVSRTWDLLARRYADDHMVIGYDIPWNEPFIRADKESRFETLYKSSWNNWLKARYTTIANLGATWQHPATALDTDESNWGLVKMPGERGSGYGGNARTYDFQQWFGDLYYNITQDCLQVIKGADKNHLIFMQEPMDPAWTYHALQIHWKFPDGVDAVTPHIYVQNENAVDDATLFSSVSYTRTALWWANRHVPVLVTEFSSDRTDDQFALPQYLDFLVSPMVQGVCIWSWCKRWSTWSVVDSVGNLRLCYAFIPDVASVYKRASVSDSSPKIALVMPVTVEHISYMLGLAESLHQLNVDYVVVPDQYVAENPLALNRYGAVIVYSEYLSTSAAMNIHSSYPGYVLWLGRDNYDNRLLESTGHFYANIGLVDPQTGWGHAPFPGNGVTETLEVLSDWGGLHKGEMFDFTTGFHGNYAPSAADVHSVDATVVLTRRGTDGVALFYTGKQALFYSHRAVIDAQYHFSKDIEDFRSIIKAFLNWAQMGPNEQNGVIVRNLGKIVAAHEWNSMAGMKVINIQGLPSGTYVLHDIIGGTRIVKESFELDAGIPVFMSANECKFLLVEPTTLTVTRR
jgi:hypothetical protein